LKLGGRAVRDLIPVSYLRELKQLRLYGVNVSDFTPLKYLSELEHLSFNPEFLAQ
jgi:hypothetical protein